MNNDLISRETLKNKLQARHSYDDDDFDKGYNIGIQNAIELLDSAPTVEPERPQGKWIEVKPPQGDLEDGIDYREECSICHEPNRHYGFDEYHNISSATYYKTKFCPNCGAYMRGGAE